MEEVAPSCNPYRATWFSVSNTAEIPFLSFSFIPVTGKPSNTLLTQILRLPTTWILSGEEDTELEFFGVLLLSSYFGAVFTEIFTRFVLFSTVSLLSMKKKFTTFQVDLHACLASARSVNLIKRFCIDLQPS